jgi:hypothetical protein
MVFYVIPMPDSPDNKEWTSGNPTITVSEDYKTAQAWFGFNDQGIHILLERFGPEWIIVKIEGIVMS